MKMKILAVLCGCILTNIALAECPKSMDTEKMMECIMIEGSGANYQEWQKEFNASLSATAPGSEVSPVTGTDIRSIKPAAGGSAK
jgi:hypothetical protein